MQTTRSPIAGANGSRRQSHQQVTVTFTIHSISSRLQGTLHNVVGPDPLVERRCDVYLRSRGGRSEARAASAAPATSSSAPSSLPVDSERTTRAFDHDIRTGLGPSRQLRSQLSHPSLMRIAHSRLEIDGRIAVADPDCRR